MSELKEKIYDVLKERTLANAATITEDGKPWTRYVMITTDQDLKISFAAFVNSRKVSQLKNNPEIHLTCGISDPMKMDPYLQIQGRAELSTDQKVKDAYWQEYGCEVFEKIFESPENPNYGVINITPHRIEYLAPGLMKPEVWEADQ